MNKSVDNFDLEFLREYRKAFFILFFILGLQALPVKAETLFIDTNATGTGSVGSQSRPESTESAACDNNDFTGLSQSFTTNEAFQPTSFRLGVAWDMNSFYGVTTSRVRFEIRTIEDDPSTWTHQKIVAGSVFATTTVYETPETLFTGWDAITGNPAIPASSTRYFIIEVEPDFCPPNNPPYARLLSRAQGGGGSYPYGTLSYSGSGTSDSFSPLDDGNWDLFLKIYGDTDTTSPGTITLLAPKPNATSTNPFDYVFGLTNWNNYSGHQLKAVFRPHKLGYPARPEYTELFTVPIATSPFYLVIPKNYNNVAGEYESYMDVYENTLVATRYGQLIYTTTFPNFFVAFASTTAFEYLTVATSTTFPNATLTSALALRNATVTTTEAVAYSNFKLPRFDSAAYLDDCGQFNESGFISNITPQGLMCNIGNAFTIIQNKIQQQINAFADSVAQTVKKTTNAFYRIFPINIFHSVNLAFQSVTATTTDHIITVGNGSPTIFGGNVFTIFSSSSATWVQVNGVSWRGYVEKFLWIATMFMILLSAVSEIKRHTRN